jgi:hypothetical protein
MARTATRLELQNRAYARGDFASQTDRFPVTEVQGYINESVADFHDFLIGAWGADYFETDYSLTTSAGTTLYPLPADFYQLLRVEVNSGTSRTECLPAQRGERAWLRDTQTRHSQYPTRYAVRGSQLELLPSPASAYSVTLEYVPCSARLTNDASTIDGVNGWDEWVVDDVARKMALKDGDNAFVDRMLQDMGRIEARIRAMAPKRDRGERRVIDVLTRGVRR